LDPALLAQVQARLAKYTSPSLVGEPFSHWQAATASIDEPSAMDIEDTAEEGTPRDESTLGSCLANFEA